MIQTPEIFATLTALIVNAALWTGAKLGALAVTDNTHLDGNTWVPVGVFVAAAVLLIPAIWKFATAFQKISDDLGYVKKKLKELPCERCTAEDIEKE